MAKEKKNINKIEANPDRKKSKLGGQGIVIIKRIQFKVTTAPVRRKQYKPVKKARSRLAIVTNSTVPKNKDAIH